mmetsp:Transcript_12026/g.38298  ORF Transcript_12026/g.38298 Transcript_12026/m.38298 type:complete len:339 (+) Transcript_12026:1776-2792(+)
MWYGVHPSLVIDMDATFAPSFRSTSRLLTRPRRHTSKTIDGSLGSAPLPISRWAASAWSCEHATASNDFPDAVRCVMSTDVFASSRRITSKSPVRHAFSSVVLLPSVATGSATTPSLGASCAGLGGSRGGRVGAGDCPAPGSARPQLGSAARNQPPELVDVVVPAASVPFPLPSPTSIDLSAAFCVSTPLSVSGRSSGDGGASRMRSMRATSSEAEGLCAGSNRIQDRRRRPSRVLGDGAVSMRSFSFFPVHMNCLRHRSSYAATSKDHTSAFVLYFIPDKSSGAMLCLVPTTLDIRSLALESCFANPKSPSLQVASASMRDDKKQFAVLMSRCDSPS